MIYVALLRGINVGGNTKVEMPRLKKAVESLGCDNVRTYINSGNVIFSDSRTATELTGLLEAAIVTEFSLTIRVLIRDLPNIQHLCDTIPPEWTNDTEQKTDVMFLWNEIDDDTILQKISTKPDIENVLYIDGALVWNIGRKNVTKGSGIKLIKTDLYKSMTVRNINTVRKLAAMMSEQ